MSKSDAADFLMHDPARDPIYGALVLIAINNAHGDICRLVQGERMRQTDLAMSCQRTVGFAEQFALGSPFHYTLTWKTPPT